MSAKGLTRRQQIGVGSCETDGCAHRRSDHLDGPKNRRCTVPDCPCDRYYYTPTESQLASWNKAAETRRAKREKDKG